MLALLEVFDNYSDNREQTAWRQIRLPTELAYKFYIQRLGGFFNVYMGAVKLLNKIKRGPDASSPLKCKPKLYTAILLSYDTTF